MDSTGMSCPLPCTVGSFCNRGGVLPYVRCVAGEKGRPPSWVPLDISQSSGRLPICPINTGPGHIPGQVCALGNSCFVSGLAGKYNCVQFSGRKPKESGLWRPTGVGWWYEEELEKPSIRVSGLSAFRPCPQTEIPGITTGTLASTNNKSGGRPFITTARRRAKPKPRSK
jgi:hypothetical protein